MEKTENQQVRFDRALTTAIEYVATREWPTVPVIVQDIYGRIRLAVDDRAVSLSEPERGEIERRSTELASQLGLYAARPTAPLYGSTLFAPDEVFASTRILTCRESSRPVQVLDRQLSGHDWLVAPGRPGPSDTVRATLYGVKGGVGRSTLLAIWAWDLARNGRRVLVLDLDLESPGVGSTLLPAGDITPDYGLVDWFVEDAVGQADDLLEDLIIRSPLCRAEAGEILVAPAAGCKGRLFLPKLARAYASIASGSEVSDFASRLVRLVKSLEDICHPDVVLLDSRAGLHDIAAVAITQLDALALLLTVNSVQSWQAYKLLFQHWKRFPEYTRRFRDRLQMVAALVPETSREDYIDDFRENAYKLFLDHLYEEECAGDELAVDAFNYSLADSDAPHAPWCVYWSRAFQEFDPYRRPDLLSEQQVSATYGDFLRRANQVLEITDGEAQ